ncbi:MAG: antitoxin family protein [bacterium]|nr:antitoxin family protein [bacterium]MDE0670037.1 antitoxin family protein [bacterium]MXZ31473.1 DUF104 domain-containing protein [Acidimicrobiia bacterium]MYB25665.1 DUF104 domain-containing protein [Acidimicrobiia bacterium]MYJ13744.1 DUF104 domain-containing protein [Acidimicrobiia bacterium]
MTTTVKATYANGVLTPLEPLEMEEGTEVTLSIEGDTEPKRGLPAVLAAIREIHGAIPAEAWDALPTDLASNKNHYLYGLPRVEED